jgi:hypothetical protein
MSTGFFCFLGMLFTLVQIGLGAAEPVKLHVDANAAQENSLRIGVNLGSASWWGENQYFQNIIPQPGFEGAVDRTLIIVGKYDDKGFYDEHGPSYPEGYWNGATYDIRSGNSAGKSGKVQSSFKSGENGLAYYIVEGDVPVLAPKDVIVVTKFRDDEKLVGWWIAKESEGFIHPDTKEKSPMSKGRRSALLDPPRGSEAKLISYVDAIGKRAGKLLLIEGKWKLSFWAKAANDGTQIKVYFARMNGTPPFLEKNITLTTDWREYTEDFVAKDEGAPEIVQLAFTAQRKLWMDDVWLGQAGKDNEAFREDVVTVLKQLNPSFLRNWQDQLSDTFENQIAVPSARRNVMNHVSGGTSDGYLYSLPEFLQLCDIVDTNPWIIIPTTFSDRELKDFGLFLKEHASLARFSHVILEFGNENWNWIFRYGGLPYPEVHGKVAERAFKIIKQEIGTSANIDYAVNGQHENPWLSEQYSIYTPSADMMSIAPYFLHKLNASENSLEVVTKLLTEDDADTKELVKRMQGSGKKLSYYEINFHATGGSASGSERNAIVAGAVSGTTLVQRLLKGMFLNFSPQMAFAFGGFDFQLANGEFVKLWGITRDLSPHLRLRPTGLGVEMLNKVIQGSIHAVKGRETDATHPIFGAAFLGAEGWTAAFTSSSHDPLEVEVVFPDDGHPLPSQALVMQSDSVFDNNEDQEKVKIAGHAIDIDGKSVRFTVPGWGVVVLTNH